MVFQVFHKCRHRQPQSFEGVVSEVQPNRALSIAQVIQKFASGQPVDIPDGIFGKVQANMSDYDYADRVFLRRKYAAEMASVQKQIAAEKKAVAEKAHQAEIDAAVQARLHAAEKKD